MLARRRGQAELVLETLAPALGVDRLERRRGGEEPERDRSGLPRHEGRRPEAHDAVLAVHDEAREGRVAQEVREDARLTEREGVGEKDVRLDVHAARGPIALADGLLGPHALDDAVRPPRERPLVAEGPRVVDQETREEVVDEPRARIGRRGARGVHGSSLPGSGRSTITYSATGLPPTRCSVMMRSRTGGSQARYHVPSG